MLVGAPAARLCACSPAPYGPPAPRETRLRDRTPVPSGTGWLIGLLMGGVIVALIAHYAGVVRVPGRTRLHGRRGCGSIRRITGRETPGNVAGYSVGITFLVMGSSTSLLRSRPGETRRRHTPKLSATGLSQMIAATAPKPLDTTKLPGDEPPKQGGEDGFMKDVRNLQKTAKDMTPPSTVESSADSAP